jgi:hypothetical protein
MRAKRERKGGRCSAFIEGCEAKGLKLVQGLVQSDRGTDDKRDVSDGLSLERSMRGWHQFEGRKRGKEGSG